MMIFTPLELFFVCWGAFLVGFVFGTAWRWLWTDGEIRSDGEERLDRHLSKQDEHGEGL